MEVSFNHPETGRTLTLKSDKNLIMIYGKNGSGKTTFTRKGGFDKKFVFNEDFIYKNIYVIDQDGAMQSAATRGNFSTLWIGEDIVKVIQNISDLSVINKDINEQKKELLSKIKTQIATHNINPNDIDQKISQVINPKFVVDLKDINNQIKDFKSTFKFKTNIVDENNLLKQSNYLKNQNIAKDLISLIKNNALLSSIIFNIGKNELDKLNNKIKELFVNFKILKEMEELLTKKGLTDDDIKEINKWCNMHENKNVCLFCGNDSIEQQKEEWKKIFEDNTMKQKKILIEEIKSNCDYSKKVLEKRELYSTVDKNLVDYVEKIHIQLKSVYDSINSNKKNFIELDLAKLDPTVADVLITIENITNYILNKYVDKLDFLHNFQIKSSEYLTKLKTDLGILMNAKGKLYAQGINDILSKIGLEKEIDFIVNNRTTPATYEFSLLRHSKISELSDGQKHKLALAMFFNYLKSNNLKNKVIVIDDPVVSLDITGYHKLKNYLIQDLTSRFSPEDNTKMIILTHDINYLYIQLSNIYDNEEMKKITGIFKMNSKSIEELPIDILKTDDVTLFKIALDKLTSIEEVRILNSIIPKIFRLLIDIQLRFLGVSETKGINIQSLKYDDNVKNRLKDISEIYCKKNLSTITDEEILNEFENLKEAADMMSINNFITSKNLKNIKKIISSKKSKIIDDYIFEIILHVNNFLEEGTDDSLKRYIEHPRNSLTKNIIGLDLDDSF